MYPNLKQLPNLHLIKKEIMMNDDKEEIEILNKLGELLMFLNEKEIRIDKVLHLIHLKISSDIIQYNLIYAEDPINRFNKWVKQSCSFYESKFLEHIERQKMRKNDFMELLNNLQKEYP